MTAFALAPRGFQPQDSDLSAVLTVRDGHVWKRGVFGGMTVAASGPLTLTLDGQSMRASGELTIKRALMRRKPLALKPRLALLDVVQPDAWNGYSGSPAWYESSDASGAVTAMIIMERPR